MLGLVGAIGGSYIGYRVATEQAEQRMALDREQRAAAEAFDKEQRELAQEFEVESHAQALRVDAYTDFWVATGTLFDANYQLHACAAVLGPGEHVADLCTDQVQEYRAADKEATRAYHRLELYGTSTVSGQALDTWAALTPPEAVWAPDPPVSAELNDETDPMWQARERFQSLACHEVRDAGGKCLA